MKLFLFLIFLIAFFVPLQAEKPEYLGDRVREYMAAQRIALAPPVPISTMPVGHPCATRIDLKNGRSFIAYWDGYKMEVKEMTPWYRKLWLWWNGR